jgi:allantoinase
MSDLIIQSRRVVTPSGCVPACVYLKDERIERVADFEDVDPDAEIIDAGDSVVMAGLVDAHVHINEPGRTEWEGFESATRAAAAGGVTTLVDMPLNCIPATTTVEGFEAKLAAAEGKCCVDVGFWGGVVPGNADELAALDSAGVLGFKCFLCPSGVDEFENVSFADLEVAMPILSELGAPLLCHSELPEVIEAAAAVWPHGDPAHYGLYLASRPPSAEIEAIAMLCELAGRFGTRLHIVHLSAAGALPFIRRARERGVDLSVETCPHYLYFSSDRIKNGATEFKCAPPIRSRGNRDKLWKALARGEIDLIGTDHSPSPPELKCFDSGRFDEAWGGVASLQLLLPVVWSAASERGHSFEELSRWLSAAPADLAGLSERKGRIAPGLSADLVIWDPEAEFVVEAEGLEHRHKATPYDGRRLKGVVETTILRGRPVYRPGHFAAPAGQAILK